MKKHAKNVFYNNLEFSLNDLNSNDSRKYWKTVKMLVKENSSDSGNIPPLIKCNNTDISYSDTEKANTLNDFFVSISNIDDSNTELPDFSFKTHSKLNNILITEQEVTDILDNLINNKAFGDAAVSRGENIAQVVLTAVSMVHFLLNVAMEFFKKD